jgi:SAM-dependent methyltransferase
MARSAARLLRRRLVRGPASGGRTHEGLTLSESVGYVEDVFEGYVRHAGLDSEQLLGARVLELGPGDNLGVALRFVAAGAAEVVAIDRFRILRDPAHETAVYRELAARLPTGERSRLEPVGADGRPGAVRAIEGVPIEEAVSMLEPTRFDLVVSCAVLEEIRNPEGAIEVMDRLLAPGGLMIHQVDFRDYGRFTGRGGHPLAFLTVADRLYGWITAGATRLNRWRPDDYRRALAGRGYQIEIRPTEVVGGRRLDGSSAALDLTEEERGLVEAARPDLMPRLRTRPAEDLAVAGALIVARKGTPLARRGMSQSVA